MGGSPSFAAVRIETMELSLLKAVLEGLGIEPEIDTVRDRKTLQKAVYLAQRRGADLGYRFGWYVKGPYSSPLADDYYLLDKNPNPEPALRLSGADEALLKPVRDILTVPDDVDLEQPEWMELLASVDYLRAVSGLSDADASQRLKELKSSLAPFETQALAAIQKAGLR